MTDELAARGSRLQMQQPNQSFFDPLEFFRCQLAQPRSKTRERFYFGRAATVAHPFENRNSIPAKPPPEILLRNQPEKDSGIGGINRRIDWAGAAIGIIKPVGGDADVEGIGLGLQFE